jgi:quinol monooxygenase YgiN
MKLPSLLASFALATIALGQSADPLAPIRAALKDPAKPFTLIVEFKLRPGAAAEARDVVESAVAATRKEPGNAAYACHHDPAEPDTLVFLETWNGLAALESHVAADYTRALLEKLGSLAAEPMKLRVLAPFVPSSTPSKRRVTLPAPSEGN